MKENALKRLLSDGRSAFGCAITIADPFVAERIGAMGFDFTVTDTEHSPITITELAGAKSEISIHVVSRISVNSPCVASVVPPSSEK